MTKKVRPFGPGTREFESFNAFMEAYIEYRTSEPKSTWLERFARHCKTNKKIVQVVMKQMKSFIEQYIQRRKPIVGRLMRKRRVGIKRQPRTRYG